MNIEVGKSYVTRGGWLAKVIYQLENGKLIVIHRQPGVFEYAEEHDEQGVSLIDGRIGSRCLIREIEAELWERAVAA